MMKCDDAAEFVSALCDGQTIPTEAAQHIDACEGCRLRMKDYLEDAVALRRTASLEIGGHSLPQLAPPVRRFGSALWRGHQSVRIPKLVLVSMLVAIVVLASGWALQDVRASGHGSVLLLQYSIGGAPAQFCAMSTVDTKQNFCGGVVTAHSGLLLFGFRVISKAGATAVLEVQAEVKPPGPNATSSDISSLPVRQYELNPGETVKVDAGDSLAIELTGQWIDHLPSVVIGAVGENPSLDPGPQELRVFDPVLVHDGQAHEELEGADSSLDKADWAVEAYYKGVGRFDISLSPMAGAVEGRVHFNRVTFKWNGELYELITGTPVARSHTIWVLCHPNPPAKNATIGSSYLGNAKVSDLTAESR